MTKEEMKEKIKQRNGEMYGYLPKSSEEEWQKIIEEAEDLDIDDSDFGESEPNAMTLYPWDNQVLMHDKYCFYTIDDVELRLVLPIHAVKFLKLYHYKKFIPKIELAYGLYKDNELLLLAPLGKSRFNKNFDIELITFCYKNNTEIDMGPELLFEHIINTIPDKSLITYCDNSKGLNYIFENLGWTVVNKTTSRKNYYNPTDGYWLTAAQMGRFGFDRLYGKRVGVLYGDYCKETNEELYLKHGFQIIEDLGQTTYVYVPNSKR